MSSCGLSKTPLTLFFKRTVKCKTNCAPKCQRCDPSSKCDTWGTVAFIVKPEMFTGVSPDSPGREYWERSQPAVRTAAAVQSAVCLQQNLVTSRITCINCSIFERPRLMHCESVCIEWEACGVKGRALGRAKLTLFNECFMMWLRFHSCLTSKTINFLLFQLIEELQ